MGLGLAEPDFHTVCYVETEPHAQRTLVAGMLAGVLPFAPEHGAGPARASGEPLPAGRSGYIRPAPVWGNLRTFVGYEWRGIVDTILAGYPCQPFSAAGQRKGADDPRHLWPDVARIIREVEPEWVFLENVAGHITLGLEAVLRELRAMGWTPAVGAFSAAETGAPHERLRVFIVAHRAGARRAQRGSTGRAEAAAQGGNGMVAEPERCGGGSVACGLENAKRAGAGSDGIAPVECGRNAVDGRGAGLRCGDGAALPDGITADGGELANADVADCRCGRCCRSGARQDQQPGRAEVERAGGALDHPTGSRCDGARIGPEANCQGGQCVSGDGCDDMGHPAGIGCGEGRAEPVIRGGGDTSASAGSAMADASRTGSQGQQRSQCNPGEWQDAPGLAGPSGGTGLFPPGPGDAAAWAELLADHPHLAPAISVGDVKRFADHLAAMVARRELAEAQAQSLVCLLSDGLANRASALRLLGNGVFPLAAAHAWRSLSAAHGLLPPSTREE